MEKVAVSFQYVCYLQLHFHSASTLVYLQRIHLVTLTEKWLVKDFRHWPRVPLLLVSTYLGIMAGECIVHPFVFHLLLFECINCKIIIIIKCETRAKFLDNVVICPRGNACRVCDYRHFKWRRQRLLLLVQSQSCTTMEQLRDRSAMIAWPLVPWSKIILHLHPLAKSYHLVLCHWQIKWRIGIFSKVIY